MQLSQISYTLLGCAVVHAAFTLKVFLYTAVNPMSSKSLLTSSSLRDILGAQRNGRKGGSKTVAIASHQIFQTVLV